MGRNKNTKTTKTTKLSVKKETLRRLTVDKSQLDKVAGGMIGDGPKGVSSKTNAC